MNKNRLHPFATTAERDAAIRASFADNRAGAEAGAVCLLIGMLAVVVYGSLVYVYLL